MTPVELSRTVLRAVRCAVDEGELSVAVPVRAVVTPPGPGGCGDYATNIALQLARPAGRPPRQVAEILRPHLSRTAGVAGVEITGPGFLNIHLEAATATIALVREILDGHANGHANGHAIGHAIDSGHDSHGTPYGHTPTLTGQVIPLRIPYDIRAEVVADSLVRIVASQGGRAEVDHVRAGEAVTLRPVPAPEDPAPLGADAARWALLHPAAHDRPRITADHLAQRESNPLFRIRYAHARARALTRCAARLGFHGEPGDVPVDVPGAEVLVRELAGYPHALSAAAAQHAPTGSPGTSSPPPTRSSPSSTPCCRSATRNPRPPTVPGSPSPKPPGRCWPVACPSSASAHPTTSDT
ncbi:hypothetical protein SAV14893_021700 [Streptomyces avermitilis]|uniref:Arginyl tRNA synthetase N-terminal domain-containing protein n=1 Tax=Streptomyces avermitilis TaxID=33903 RepID=A0A4D4LX58_STRAX|nr:hypothetical protein SAV14893_021700 [Streptomyces avermitilis]